MFGKTLAETGNNVYYIVSKIISDLNILCPKLELIKTKYTLNLYKEIFENWFYH